MTSNIWNNLNINKICNIRANIPHAYYLKHLHAIDPSFVTITKKEGNKIRETNILRKIEMNV